MLLSVSFKETHIRNASLLSKYNVPCVLTRNITDIHIIYRQVFLCVAIFTVINTGIRTDE